MKARSVATEDGTRTLDPASLFTNTRWIGRRFQTQILNSDTIPPPPINE